MNQDDLTLHALLERVYREYPDRPSLCTVGGDHPTYREFYEQVQSVSHMLRERGVLDGDRVAILSENQPRWGVAFFAVTTMGAVAVPILPDFHSSEVHHILRHAEAKALFVSMKLYPKVEDTDFPHLTTIILLDDFAVVPARTVRERLAVLVDEGRREFARLREAAKKLAGRPPARLEGSTLAEIIYTSGTTGHSKGVMLTHGNIVSDVRATLQIVSVTSSDRMLSILPLAHTYECTLGLVGPVMVGASVHYLDRPPTAAALLPALKEVRPTIMLSVPLIIEKIYKTRVHPQLTRSGLLRAVMKVPAVRRRLHRIAGRKLLDTFGGQLRIFTIGGASLAPDVEQFLREAKFPYAIGYGLTETSPLVAGSGPEATRYRSTGPPLPGTEIVIRDPDPVSGEGEIVIRGPTVMKGYYKDPVRTAEVLSPDGWFRSGDLGVIDKQGYLYIRGRSKNVIIGANGKNIYPEEVEAALGESDCVLESLVFDQGGKLTARVYLDYESLDKSFASEGLSDREARDRITEMLEDIRREVNTRLSSFARIHRIIEQTEPFEKTPTQKIKRHLYVA